jgi:TRAP-type C4-dicarboxylate transport system permease small subunit
MFSRGASMPHPDGILSGTGKKARHIRVEKLTDEMGEKIRKYLHTAVEVNN